MLQKYSDTCIENKQSLQKHSLLIIITVYHVYVDKVPQVPRFGSAGPIFGLLNIYTK